MKWVLGDAPLVKAALGLAVGLSLLCATTLVQSQALPGQLPTTAEPTKPFERPVPEFKAEPLRELRVTPAPGNVAPAEADSMRFVLKGIIIEGQTVYKVAEFEGFYTHLIGTMVKLTDLFDIARKIEAMYRRNGYILTRAVIPVQTVIDSVFKIEVIEGFIDTITISGDVGPVRSLIERYLDKIKPKNTNGPPHPTNIRDLERYLLLVNDLPGITVRGVPRRRAGEGVKKGASELIVEVKRKEFGASASVDNRGSRFAGPWRANVLGVANSRSKIGERMSLSFFSALDMDNKAEQRSARVEYLGNIGSEGLTARVFAGFSPSRPGFTLKALGVRSRATQLGMSFSYPIIRTYDLTLRAGIGFDYTNSYVDILNTRSSVDHLRVAHLSTTLEFNDSYRGLNRVEFRIDKGLNVLGTSAEGSNLLTRSEASGEFTKFTLEVLRRQSLLSNFWLLLSAKNQFTNYKLLAIEEFRVGGERFGRGYNPAELSGDRGLGASAELQYSNMTGWRYLSQYELYGFYDFGAVWNTDTDKAGQLRRESLASLGVGVKMKVMDQLWANIELAKPLTAPLSTRSDLDLPLRVFFRVSSQF
jgi:hemolysin activation/secretion protein